MNGAKIEKGESARMALESERNVSTMPHMDGVAGYFVPETQDVSNQVWRDMLGGNSITLNGAIQAGKAIGLRENPHSWGQLYIEEPVIIYIIVKYANDTLINKTSVPPVLTKSVYDQSQQGYYAFNVRGNKSLAFWVSSGNNDAVINRSDTASFHVMCIAKTGNNSKISTYLDGDYAASTTNPAKMGSYKGFYMLNNMSHWTTSGTIDFPWNFDYLMLGFGTQAHSAEQIKANSEWLYNKYISEEPDPVPDPYKGIKIYKDIILMNGAKILNEDGTEYMT